MPPNKKQWTAADDDELRRLHREGLGCNQAARAMGYTPTTVSRHAKELGLDWLRTEQVATAVKAQALTNAEKRVELETELWDRAKAMLGQLDEPHLVYSFGGKDNSYNEHHLDRIDVKGQLDVMRAVSIAVDKAARIADINTAAKDMSDVDMWLNDMTGGAADARRTAGRPLTTA